MPELLFVDMKEYRRKKMMKGVLLGFVRGNETGVGEWNAGDFVE